MEDRGRSKENVVEILCKDGMGKEWMNELEGARGAKEKE